MKLIVKFLINLRYFKKLLKIFTNQNFYIDYYIIYTNIQKKFYKLHFYIIKKFYVNSY
jgi:hypothetical protein